MVWQSIYGFMHLHMNGITAEWYHHYSHDVESLFQATSKQLVNYPIKQKDEIFDYLIMTIILGSNFRGINQKSNHSQLQ